MDTRVSPRYAWSARDALEVLTGEVRKVNERLSILGDFVQDLADKVDALAKRHDREDTLGCIVRVASVERLILTEQLRGQRRAGRMRRRRAGKRIGSSGTKSATRQFSVLSELSHKKCRRELPMLGADWVKRNMPIRPKTRFQRLKPLLIILAGITFAVGLVWLLAKL
jgi:hypothetical protein